MTVTKQTYKKKYILPAEIWQNQIPALNNLERMNQHDEIMEGWEYLLEISSFKGRTQGKNQTILYFTKFT